jgi:homopolymeric O-antigen transport system permease protein
MTNASVETELGSAAADPPRADAGHASAVRARAGLVWTLIRTDFKVRYHGTAGGFVWALLKPLTMFVLLMAVFSFLFASDPNYKLNLIIALFLWDFFAESTKVGLTSLHAKGFLLSKAKCPSWILVVTSISNAVITLGVFTLVILVFLAAAGRMPTVGGMLMFIVYCASFVLIVMGFSLGSSVLFLRYRDLNQVWDVVSQAGFFLAPIIYPLSILPERFHFYLYLWPPTAIIEFSRAVLVRGTMPTATAHLCLIGVTALALVIGAWLFRRLAPRAAEYL